MAKTPFHVWSGDGSGVPVALRLQRDGHPVTLYIKSPDSQLMGKGLVPRANVPPKGAVVLFDCTGQGAIGATYRRQGHLVLGGNRFEKDLELDRPTGGQIARAAGMKLPPTFPFKTVPDAIRFLKGLKTVGTWFVKVSGDQIESATYDAPDPDAMIRYLEWTGSRGKVEPFELQQKIEGTEVSCNGWFNGQEFVPPFDLTFEIKHFLTGEVGPRTGCEACVVYHAQDDALADKTVALVSESLADEGYVGTVDVNSIVDTDGTPWFLEFTARLGYDSTPAWMRLFGSDLGEQMEAFAAGELDAWEPASDHLSGTLRVSIPPYPTWDPALIKKSAGLPLDFKGHDAHMDLTDVQAGPTAAGGTGVIGAVTALGTNLADLPPILLKRARAVEIPNKQYRMDPLAGVAARMKALAGLKLLGRDL